MQKAKRIFVLSLCLLLVLAFSACRNNDGGETPQGDAKAGGEITVGIAADLDSSLEDHAADEWRYLCMSRPVRALAPVPQEHRLLIVPGSTFGCAGYVRIAYCVDYEMIKRALPEFKALAEEYK